jgi:EXPERA (EXPanded EBP superfamily)
MDAQAIYPPSLVPAFMKDLEAFYVNTYNDQLFVEKPRFFQTFIWFELFTQVPALIWAIPALLRGKS